MKYKSEDQSIKLVQNNSLLPEKLDQVLEENKHIKLKSDSILYQLAQINTKTIQTLEKNSQIKAQSDTILQNSIILSQNNMIFKSKLDQLPAQIHSMILHSLLIDKIKKVEIVKKIPGLHTDTIYKIISYDNNTKYITCSADKTIIIRNCEDNIVIRTLPDHNEAILDILLLSDGRLASSSEDKTIKIWNLTNGNCDQTLIGHSHTIYCLLELPNSMLLSGSADSSIGLWDISQKDKNELQFYHQVKNDKQSYAYCMTLINANELAVTSYKNINIYSFNNATNKSFNVIKTLKGHTSWIFDIKLMNNSRNLLISCSEDRDCRLWSILNENCLKIFKGHSDTIWSIQILSDKIFVSGSTEIIFWNIDKSEAVHLIKPDDSESLILSLLKNDSNELVFAGMHDFIGFIKI